jgi:dipeptidyl aminopeptidase/acylaminoacyl peptidase
VARVLHAERDGAFMVDDVSPVRAATAIKVPVFLVHGLADTETPPDHSRRVFAALTGERHLRLVPGAGHGNSLRREVWEEIEGWLDGVLGSHTPTFREPSDVAGQD